MAGQQSGVGSFLTVDGDGRVVLAVHVQPGARRSEVVGPHGDALKVKVTAPPVDGKANRAVGELLAATFELPRDAVELLTGASSRRKRFRLTGVSSDDVATRLGRHF
jgi:uncharacterized protein